MSVLLLFVAACYLVFVITFSEEVGGRARAVAPPRNRLAREIVVVLLAIFWPLVAAYVLGRKFAEWAVRP